MHAAARPFSAQVWASSRCSVERLSTCFVIISVFLRAGGRGHIRLGTQQDTMRLRFCDALHIDSILQADLKCSRHGAGLRTMRDETGKATNWMGLTSGWARRLAGAEATQNVSMQHSRLCLGLCDAAGEKSLGLGSSWALSAAERGAKPRGAKRLRVDVARCRAKDPLVSQPRDQPLDLKQHG